MVRREFPQVDLIASPVNGGYPYGNNVGLRHLGFHDQATGGASMAPRFALLLNPDTIVPPTALADMLAFCEAQPDSVAWPGQNCCGQMGHLDLASRRSFPTPAVSFYRMVGLSKLLPRSPHFRSALQPDLPQPGCRHREFDSVGGALVLMQAARRWPGCGLLDETFFMYGKRPLRLGLSDQRGGLEGVVQSGGDRPALQRSGQPTQRQGAL